MYGKNTTHTGHKGCSEKDSMSIHGMSKIAQLYGKCRKLKQFTCCTCVGRELDRWGGPGSWKLGAGGVISAIKGLNLRATRSSLNSGRVSLSIDTRGRQF